MKMDFDLSDIDFSELQFDEIGLWPLPLRIACIVVVCVAAVIGTHIFVLKGQLKNLDEERKKEVIARQEFKEKYNLAANLDQYEKQMLEIRENYKSLLKQLPSDGQIPQLIDAISQEANKSNLQYELIKPGESKSLLGFYKEMPIDLKMIGTYHSFGEFISNLSMLPRIVTMHDFDITRYAPGESYKGPPMLILNIEAKTYWLSQEDLNNKDKEKGTDTESVPRT